MNFSDKLNYYINEIGCSAKDLSFASGLSGSVISRYRSGERIPKCNSKQFNLLISGFEKLIDKNKMDISVIYKDFHDTLIGNNIDFESFRNNFNLLIVTLKINVSELSKYIGFDASYVSKIRTGVRKPQNIKYFVDSVIKYLVNYYNDSNSLNLLSSLTGYDIDKLSNKDIFINILNDWICNNNSKEDNIIDNFLIKLDLFDLNDYIKSIKFDKLVVPTIPFNIPKCKKYYGVNGFKNSQIDILKSIILSKSKEDILFYSSMPMDIGKKDKKFTKKFMFGLALILKKGIHLNIIHNLNRPFHEILMGLEGWIPLYMTGQISPYYFKNVNNSIFNNLEFIGGSSALSGSCISCEIKTAKFYLTTKSNELLYYKNRSKLLLNNASCLMEIYNLDKKKYIY